MTWVLDTNVLLMANGQHEGDDLCELEAVLLIQRARKEGDSFGLDSLGHILREYGRNIEVARPPLAGAQLLLALYQYQDRKDFVITPDQEKEYLEFPSDPLLRDFDRSDRKFVAVALEAGDHQLAVATDTDFWENRRALTDNRVNLFFTCPHRFEPGDR